MFIPVSVAFASCKCGAIDIGCGMSQLLRLYYAPDNASLCVRLALDEMGIGFETVLVDRRTGGQKTPAYLAMNPNGLIPVLVTPNGSIYETAAILLWLADQDAGEMFPAPQARARQDALTWLFWLSNTFHPALRMLFYPEHYSAGDQDALRAQTRTRLQGYLQQLNDQADWVKSDRPSILKCYLAPMLRWAALYGGDTTWFDLANYPNLHAFTQRFERRDSADQASRAEGLGQTPFSAPSLPNPPEGSAT